MARQMNENSFFYQHRQLDRQIKRYNTLLRVTKRMYDRQNDETERIRIQWDIDRYENMLIHFITEKNELRIDYECKHRPKIQMPHIVPENIDYWLRQNTIRIGGRE